VTVYRETLKKASKEETQEKMKKGDLTEAWSHDIARRSRGPHDR